MPPNTCKRLNLHSPHRAVQNHSIKLCYLLRHNRRFNPMAVTTTTKNLSLKGKTVSYTKRFVEYSKLAAKALIIVEASKTNVSDGGVKTTPRQ